MLKGSVTQKWGIAAAEQREGRWAGCAWTRKKGLTKHSGTLPDPISARLSLPAPSEGEFVIGAQWPITGSEHPLARGCYRPGAASGAAESGRSNSELCGGAAVRQEWPVKLH